MSRSETLTAELAERVRVRAYFIWEKRGARMDADASGIWLEAEAEEKRTGEFAHEPLPPAPERKPANLTGGQEGAVREAFRAAWDHLLDSVLESTLIESHENASAEKVAADLWPGFELAKVQRLDQADPAYLCCERHHPSNLNSLLTTRLLAVAEKYLATNYPNNRHARGSKLHDLVKGEVKYRWTSILHKADAVFERRQTDQLAQARDIRAKVLLEISNRCLAECQALSSGTGDEATARWHLKLLAALTTGPTEKDIRAPIIEGLRDGQTRRFPYVPRYLQTDLAPTVESFRGDLAPTFDGFTPELLAVFPDSADVQAILRRYVNHGSVLGPLLADIDRPVPAEDAERFDNLDQYAIPTLAGIAAPKAVVLRQRRAEFRRLPDGVVCAVSLAILLEWTLRQALYAAGQKPNDKWRGHELVERLSAHVTFRPETKSRLRVVFSNRSLNLRDVFAHGIFFADRTDLLDPQIFGLTHTLALLMSDMRAAKLWDKFATEPRWDAGNRIDTEDENTIIEQVGDGLTLLDQFRVVEGREHVSKVLKQLTPDKWMLGEGSFLLWTSFVDRKQEGQPISRDKQLIAMLGAMISFEELYRAVCELDKQATLIVSRDGKKAVKCELAVLDVRDHGLLAPVRLQKLFPLEHAEVGFQRSVAAIRHIRDKVMHGEWHAWSASWPAVTEVTLKLIFALCSVVDFQASPRS